MADDPTQNPESVVPPPEPAAGAEALEGADAEMAEGGADAEFRPCSYCGASIHPSSHRCPDCGGNVGVSWGTVHKEIYLFLFSACMIAVSIVVSWDETRGSTANGFNSIKGALMFALAIYGMFRAVISLLNRSMIVWPFFVNAMLALWVGISGIIRCSNSATWKQYKALPAPGMLDKYENPLHAIPPGYWLMTIAGVLVVIVVLKGVVAGFAAGSAKAKPASKKDGKRRR